MNADEHVWQDWARILQRWGIKDWVASFLEAAGPLTIIGAQIIYLSSPMLDFLVPESHLDTMARLLEDRTQTNKFAAFLREMV